MNMAGTLPCPGRAVLELTFRCNQECPFCYAPWLENPELNGPELPIEEWISVAGMLADHGVAHFTLSGGEPLLKEGLGRLLEFLAVHPKRPDFTVFTNGLAADDRFLERLRGTRGGVACSLPGLKEFPRLTGSENSVYRMIDLFARMKRFGIPFSVNIPVTRPVLGKVKELVALAVFSGAASVQAGSVVAEGRCLRHPELALTFDENRKLARLVETLRKHTPVPLSCSDEPYCSCRTNPHPPAGTPADYRPPPCSVERQLLVVGPAGKVRKCLHLDRDEEDVRDRFR